MIDLHLSGVDLLLDPRLKVLIAAENFEDWVNRSQVQAPKCTRNQGARRL